MKKQLARKLSSPINQFNQPVERLFPLDLLKAMSITAVVSYHSVFVPRSTYTASLLPMDTLFASLRFCVPVLFTISFLLFERGLTNHSTETAWPLIKKRLVRLAIPTVFWFSLTAGLKLLKGDDLPEIISAVLNGTIFYGAYYLIVILQFIPVFIWLRHWFSKLHNVLVTVVLQCLVFLLIYTALSMHFAPQLIAVLRTIDRPLFLYWFGYMALGCYFWKTWPLVVKISCRIPTQFKIFALGLSCLLLASEYHRLFLVSGGQIPPFDYATLSSILSVVVIFLCFASVESDQLPLPLKKGVLLLSQYSLGIFCINGFISELFFSFGSHQFRGATFNLVEMLVMKFVGWGILLTLSLALSVLLDRIGLRACVR